MLKSLAVKTKFKTKIITKKYRPQSLAVVFVVVLASFLIAPFMSVPEAKADEYDDRIRAIQLKIDAYQEQARGLSQKADTLQRELDIITNEKAAIQAQIDLNQAEYDKLQQQIKDNNNRIEANKDVLGETLADMYVEGDISSLEMLASSNNIGDYMDKQEYLSSIRDTLKGTIDDIDKAQKELEKQKVAVEQVLNNQKNNRAALQKKEDEQASLGNQTRGEEAAYQSMIASGRSEQNALRDQQAIQRALEVRQNQSGGVTWVGGSDGGYPWSEYGSPGFPPCRVGSDMLSYGGANGRGGDGWGYGCRQCASYVAWRIGQRTGIIPTNVGDAIDFTGLGTNHRTARANSVGVMTYAGRPGHVVWVETDPDASGYITVAQYNYYDISQGGSGWGHFTRMRVHQSTYNAFIYY